MPTKRAMKRMRLSLLASLMLPGLCLASQPANAVLFHFSVDGFTINKARGSIGTGEGGLLTLNSVSNQAIDLTDGVAVTTTFQTGKLSYEAGIGGPDGAVNLISPSRNMDFEGLSTSLGDQYNLNLNGGSASLEATGPVYQTVFDLGGGDKVTFTIENSLFAGATADRQTTDAPFELKGTFILNKTTPPPPPDVPEPGAMALLVGMGVGGLGLLRHARRR